jgi:RHS repeat-associated protein
MAAKIERETDFTLGANSPLIVSRTYNSRTLDYPPGMMGIGWRLDFELSAPKFTPPITVDEVRAQQYIQFTRETGEIIEFTYDSTSQSWLPDADEVARVTEIQNNGTLTGWTLFPDDTGNYEIYGVDGKLQQIVYKNGTDLYFTYDSNSGLLTTAADQTGRSIRLSYHNGLLSTITLPDGTPIGYQYNGNVLSDAKYQEFDGQNYVTVSRHYSYANGSELNGLTDENGKLTSSWTYDSDGRVTSSSRGPLSQPLSTIGFNYLDNDQVQVTSSLGGTVTLSYGVLLDVNRIAGADAYCQECGADFASRTYDSNGHPQIQTDFNSNVTKFTFDTGGLETQRIEAQNTAVQRTTNTQWDDVLRNPLDRQVLDANNNLTAKTDWTYNSRGQVLARCEYDPSVSGGTSYVCINTGTPPAGVRRWTYTYCDSVGSGCPLIGLLLSVDGPRTDVSDVTHYTYYSTTDESGCWTPGGACHHAGDLDKTTDPLGHVTEAIAYDENGRIARSKDANGVLTDFTYTPRGWLYTRTVRANADGSPSSQDATTTIDYWPVGTVKKVTQPDGVYTHYDYDDAHRLTQITDSLGNYIKYTLDAAGNRTEEDTYAGGGSTPSRTLSRHFNTLGQLDHDFDAYSYDTAYQYDPNGNRTDASDPNLITTHSNYDALNRLSQTIQNYNGSDPSTQNTTTSYGYDSHDNLTQVTDPNTLITNYTYDGLNNLGQLQSPDTGTTHYTFDAAGNRITQTDAKSVLVTYGYDALNRLTSISYPTSTLNIHYYYDEPNSTTGCSSSYPIGRLTRMTDSSGSTAYCYDQRGNVIAKSVLIGTVPANTHYVYNLADRLMEVDYPGNDADVVYTRDADGRIASVSNGSTPIVTAINYLPFGPATQYTFASGGQTLVKNYDLNYHSTDITGSAINLHFALDKLGNISKEGDAAGVPTPNESYQYDPLYRLKEVDGAAGTLWQKYSYSKTGDRLSKNTAGITPVDVYHYATGTHHLSSITGADASARSFDLNGNTTALQANGWTYGLGYNNTNRLSLVQQSGSTIMQYRLDGKGQRVRKVPTSGTATEYVYDEAGKVLYEYVAPNNNRSYVWADNTLIATVEADSSIHYVYTDHLGSPRAVTNTTSGTPIWTWPWTQNPFGEKPASGSGYALNVRYPGQYFDAETGLSYNFFRDYEMGTGRYIESDPRGLAAHVNTYAYTSGNPLMERDRKGLQAAPPETIPPEQQSPYPLRFPSSKNSSGPVSVIGIPDDQFPHAPEPNIPQYTMVCVEYYCDPDYGRPYCTANGGPRKQPIIGPYPLESLIDSEPGCFCTQPVPEDLVQQ